MGIRVYQDDSEINIFMRTLKKAKELEGDLLEVGVWRGGMTQRMAEECPNKHVYAFDTFEGFPDDISVADGDSTRYAVGDMNDATIELVTENLKDNKNVSLHKGRFPDTMEPIKDKKFCFAHLDVDIYKATKEALPVIFDRLVPGGYLIVHDYPAHPGVVKAVDEFLKINPVTRDIFPARQIIIRKPS